MAEKYFRKNGTTYHLDWRSDVPCEERLGYKEGGGTVRLVPAMSTQGTKVYGGAIGTTQYYYDTSSPTIAFRKNGKTYYCSKSMTTASYSIPAGTYTISAFQTIIKNLYGISSWGTGKNGSYIEKTWSNTNIKQNNKFPANTSGSRKVRLYRYGNGDPFWSYDWLTTAYSNTGNQWCTTAYLTDTYLRGIIMFAGEMCANPVRPPNSSNPWLNYYPVTVVDGINVT